MCNRFRLVAGLTFIELLVSLLLSSLIMLGLTQLVMAHLKSDLLIRDIASAQQIGRFGIYALTRDIQLAGYVDELGAYLSPLNWSLIQDQSIDPLGVDNDRLALQRIAFDGDYNCLGYPVATGTLVESDYYVKKGKLYCAAKYTRVGESSASSRKSDAQVLIEQIESFNILFGIKLKNSQSSLHMADNHSAYVTAYIRANEFKPNEHEVLSVRIALIVKSAQKLSQYEQLVSLKNVRQSVNKF